ncbi:MAG: UDP-N-acetylmuramoyl-tripeptide--D-alanyl-D-alanine ligase [candidate division WOR-3 bacterium]
MKLSVKEVIEITNGILIRGREDSLIENIATDSRNISPNDFFLPLKGKNFDGHSFIREAKEKGAKGIIFSKEIKEELPIMIKVSDTKTALKAIASYYRKKFHPKVVAVTGSNGKTTVKEMVAHIAQIKYKVLKAKESYNNDIGLPLTILELNEETEVLVLEMEMNEIGGTRSLCQIALPEIGVITNISETHLEFMKTKEGVAKEKKELLESLPEDGFAILNFDDPLIREIAEEFSFKKITFGLSQESDFFAQDIQFFPEKTEYLLQGKYRVLLKTIGEGNVYNSLAALAVSSALGIDLREAVSSLANFQPPPLRYQVIDLANYKILLDCYNANPASMLEALKTLKIIAPGRKIGVLGDMKELGEREREFHLELGKRAKDYLDILIAVGDLAEVVIEGARKAGMAKERTFPFKEREEAVRFLLEIIKPYDTILFKGSRVMSLEIICQELLNSLKRVKNLL